MRKRKSMPRASDGIASPSLRRMNSMSAAELLQQEARLREELGYKEARLDRYRRQQGKETKIHLLQKEMAHINVLLDHLRSRRESQVRGTVGRGYR